MASTDKTPYLQDSDFTLFQGEALETLKTLPSESVHCVVTSPPYWGLRDYGTAVWEAPSLSESVGDRLLAAEDTLLTHWTKCDHAKNVSDLGSSGLGGGKETQGHRMEMYRDVCRKCGARRVDQALGLEATPELYVERMVEVFREVRRVLRSDGVCWVNLGDSYNSIRNDNPGDGFRTADPSGQPKAYEKGRGRNLIGGLKQKDLVGIPWRVAFALQADGWYLRSDVVWSKPNPMPESVTDRPTKAHEYVFLLTKSARYFFDQEAVREPAEFGRGTDPTGKMWARVGNGDKDAEHVPGGKGHTFEGGRNVRSVWEIATQPYPEAHFATYPEELVRRCILAGSSERGCCQECGAPWEREVEKTAVPHWKGGHKGRGVGDAGGMTDMSDMGRFNWNTKTIGWRPSCSCVATLQSTGEPLEIPDKPIPCTVLDPFGGSGTTALVARKHGRRSILIELSPEYCALAARRLQQLSLLSEVPRG